MTQSSERRNLMKYTIHVCIKRVTLREKKNYPLNKTSSPSCWWGGGGVSEAFILQLAACHGYERSETTHGVCRGNQRKNFHCLNRTGYWVHRHVKVAQILTKYQDYWS